MNEVARRKAEKAGDCKLWSAQDALEDTLERLKKGEIDPQQLVIVMLDHPDVNEDRRFRFVASGVSVAEHIALLNAALKDVMDEWMGK